MYLQKTLQTPINSPKPIGTHLRLGSWNIKGLGTKTEDSYFKKLLLNYDILILVETWLQEDIAIEGYYCYTKTKKKTASKGRFAGGISIICNEQWKKKKGITIVDSTEMFVWVKLSKTFFSLQNDLYLCAVYIPPSDSTIYKQTKVQPFVELEMKVSEFKEKGDVILMGDFNARTVNSPDYIEFDSIKHIDVADDLYSQDTNTSIRQNLDQGRNKFGSYLLEICQRLQLRILNGRTMGDLLGQFTSYQPKGKSVVDYGIVNQEMVPNVSYFEVSPPCHLSDHALIEMALDLGRPKFKAHREGTQEGDLIHQRLNWNAITKDRLTKLLSSKEFLDKQEKLVQTFTESDDIDLCCVALRDNILEIMSSSQMLKRVTGKNRRKARKICAWYDQDCNQLKNKVLSMGKLVMKYPKDPVIYGNFFKCKKRYKKLIKAKELEFKTAILNRIESLEGSNPKEYWKLVESLKEHKHSNNPISLEIWQSHFKELLDSKKPDTDPKLREMETTMQEMVDSKLASTLRIPILDSPITGKEVSDTIHSLKNGKATGEDMIPNEVLKRMGSVLNQTFAILFNKIISNCKYPKSWSTGLICPIYKKGERDDPNNYRGITITNSISKIFTSIMNKRLTQFLEKENSICVEQIGFTKKCSTSDHILVLKTLIDSTKMKHKGLYVCFVDFSKAFDTIWHTGLLYKMCDIGLSSNFVKLMSDMYSQMTAKVKMKNQITSREFPIGVGTRQGCNLSPSLFKIFLNDLPRYLDQCGCSPVTLLDTTLSALLYADDLVLVSTSAEGLQKCMNLLGRYCTQWKLKINLSKTKVMVFNKRNRDISIVYNGHKIQVVDNYCYLGLVIHSSGTFTSAIKSLAAKATKAYYKMRTLVSGVVPVGTTVKLFNCMVRPIALYGSEIWGGYMKDFKKPDFLASLCSNDQVVFEQLQNKFCKQTLMISSKASNLACKAELGKFPLALDIMISMIGFYSRVCCKDPNTLASKAILVQRQLATMGAQNNFISAIDAIAKALKLTIIPGQLTDKHTRNKFMKTVKEKIYKWYANEFFPKTMAQQEGKLRVLRQVKSVFRLENYLKVIKNPKIRSSICRLRISDHKLPIETGRYTKPKIPAHERYCNLCDQQLVGDEFHLLTECLLPELVNLRLTFLKEVEKKVLQIKSLTGKPLFLYIFSLADESITKEAGIYIHNCLNEFKKYQPVVI
jgi:exonuclease III